MNVKLLGFLSHNVSLKWVMRFKIKRESLCSANAVHLHTLPFAHFTADSKTIRKLELLYPHKT